jgi:Icc protein
MVRLIGFLFRPCCRGLACAKWALPIFLTLFFIHGCSDPFDYSPFEVDVPREARGQTDKNLGRLLNTDKARDTTATVRIGLLADAHYHFQDIKELVNQLNGESVDFVIVLGDIVDQGLVSEFEILEDVLNDLKMPYLTVIGNHEYLANGEDIYDQLYGSRNYSFSYAGYHFIAWDDVYWEKNGTPDWDWLESRLKQTDRGTPILLAHIPPWGDQFPEADEARYVALTEQYGVQASLHGHKHQFGIENYNNDILYATVPAVDKLSYGILTLENGQVRLEQRFKR